jgi:AcrR family transcriptional regulator
MVHYYFDSRDGLIAEAAHLVYARYVAALWEAVEAAPRTPLDRLRTFLSTGLRLNVEMRGWGAVLNYYPYFSSAIAGIVEERFQQDHSRLYEQNLAMTLQLVRDVWEDRITDGAPDRIDPIADRSAMEAIAGPLFGVHGLAVWRAGHVIPTEGGSETERAADAIAAAHLEDIVERLAASRPTLDLVPDPTSASG